MTRLLPTSVLLLLLTACSGAGDGTSDGMSPGDTGGLEVLADLRSDAPPDSLSDTAAAPETRTADGVVDVPPEPIPDTVDPLPAIGEPAPDTGWETLDTAEETLVDSAPEVDPPPQVPLPGFGEITGACGVLGPAELTGPSPAVFVNHLDLGDDPYDDGDLEFLTAGGQEIWSDGNAGGSSIYSEMFAYEMLQRCELAILLKTEMEVEYQVPDSKITDLLVEIDGLKIGVSVTRAVGWPRDGVWTADQAVVLLEKKLLGIQDSSAAVAPGDAWTKQILHIIAYADQHADMLQTVLAADIAPEIVGDTIVIVTVSDGDDAFLY